jgi:hypothetical protein
MKYAIIACLLAFSFASVDACVTYSPSTGTYTVDKYGSVQQPGKKDERPANKLKPKVESKKPQPKKK